MSRFAFPACVVAAALSLAACASDPEPAVPPALLQTALDACTTGRVTRGLAQLDSLNSLSPGNADVLATRGLCRAVRFAADSVQADARSAYADLSAAIDLITAAPDAFQTPLDRLYSQRGFVVRSMRPDDWSAAFADFDRAVELSPENAVYVLDRGVAHALSGDTAAARADLRRFERLAPEDSIQALSLRDLLTPRASRRDSLREGTGE